MCGRKCWRNIVTNATRPSLQRNYMYRVRHDRCLGVNPCTFPCTNDLTHTHTHRSNLDVSLRLPPPGHRPLFAFDHVRARLRRRRHGGGRDEWCCAVHGPSSVGTNALHTLYSAVLLSRLRHRPRDQYITVCNLNVPYGMQSSRRMLCTIPGRLSVSKVRSTMPSNAGPYMVTS